MKKISILALGLMLSFAFSSTTFACGDEAAAKKCGDKAKTCCSKKDGKSAAACSGKDHKKASTDASKKETETNKDAKKASN